MWPRPLSWQHRSKLQTTTPLYPGPCPFCHDPAFMAKVEHVDWPKDTFCVQVSSGYSGALTKHWFSVHQEWQCVGFWCLPDTSLHNVLGMSYREEDMGKTQDTLEGLCLTCWFMLLQSNEIAKPMDNVDAISSLQTCPECTLPLPSVWAAGIYSSTPATSIRD